MQVRVRGSPPTRDDADGRFEPISSGIANACTASTSRPLPPDAPSTRNLLELASIQEALGAIISRQLLGYESLEKIFKDGCQIQGQEQTHQDAHSVGNVQL